MVAVGFLVTTGLFVAAAFGLAVAFAFVLADADGDAEAFAAADGAGDDEVLLPTVICSGSAAYELLLIRILSVLLPSTVTIFQSFALYPT